MIWIDITDSKYVLFFRALLPYLRELDEVFITTRKSYGYDECARLLALFGIQSVSVGGYGGGERLGKLKARLVRQEKLLELVTAKSPRIFLTGVSVEGSGCAFGLGIPVVQFSDTPIAGSSVDVRLLTKVARLSLPLSELIFYPFVLPKECFFLLGMDEENLKSYGFIDVALWLDGIEDLRSQRHVRKSRFLDALGLQENLPLILVREEEYKAHYVKEQLDVLYKSVHLLHKNLRANIVIMPRYESESLLTEFGGCNRVKVLEQKFFPQEFYPFIDVVLGGGGTMNLEASYLGIPTISMRSLLLFHDVFLIRNGFMQHTLNPQDTLELVSENLGLARGENKSAFVQGDVESAKREIVCTLKRIFY